MAIRVFKKTALQIAFGRMVRLKRECLRISQESLAEKADLNTNYIGSIERGERNIGLEVLYRLAHALKTHPKNLLPDHIEGKFGIPAIASCE